MISLTKYGLDLDEIKYIAKLVSDDYRDIFDRKRNPIIWDNYRAYSKLAETGEIPISSKGPTKGKPLAAILATWANFDKKARDYINHKERNNDAV